MRKGSCQGKPQNIRSDLVLFKPIQTWLFEGDWGHAESAHGLWNSKTINAVEMNLGRSRRS